MRKITNKALLLAVAAFTILTSCQKEISFDDEVPNANRSIVGDWKFVGASGNMQSTISGTVNGTQGKGIATINFLSKNNSGTATFTADNFSYSGITYDVDTTASVKVYVMGFLVQEIEQPIVFNFPPASKSVGYEVNSTDSLTFESIPIDPAIPTIPGIPPIPQPALPAGPFGARIAWSGDTLLIKTKLTFSQTITQPQALSADIVMDNTIKFLKP
jgi:hypothetical protein